MSIAPVTLLIMGEGREAVVGLTAPLRALPFTGGAVDWVKRRSQPSERLAAQSPVELTGAACTWWQCVLLH